MLCCAALLCFMFASLTTSQVKLVIRQQLPSKVRFLHNATQHKKTFVLKMATLLKQSYPNQTVLPPCTRTTQHNNNTIDRNNNTTDCFNNTTQYIPSCKHIMLFTASHCCVQSRLVYHQHSSDPYQQSTVYG